MPFERLVRDLPEAKAVALENALAYVLSVHGLDLAGTEWLKALGDGLHEFRVRHDAETVVRMFGGPVPPAVLRRPEQVLLRLFVHFHGDRVILLFGGYDERADPSERCQQRGINAARKLLAQFRQRHRDGPG